MSLVEAIKALTKQAERSLNAPEAMQYTQAVQNLANATETLKARGAFGPETLQEILHGRKQAES